MTNKFKFGDRVWHDIEPVGFGVVISTENGESYVAFKSGTMDWFSDAELTLATGWVKCSERMPEHGCYLVVSKNKEMNESFIGMEYFTHGAYRKNKFEEITHWMPLPTPPQD